MREPWREKGPGDRPNSRGSGFASSFQTARARPGARQPRRRIAEPGFPSGIRGHGDSPGHALRRSVLRDSGSTAPTEAVPGERGGIVGRRARSGFADGSRRGHQTGTAGLVPVLAARELRAVPSRTRISAAGREPMAQDSSHTPCCEGPGAGPRLTLLTGGMPRNRRRRGRGWRRPGFGPRRRGWRRHRHPAWGLDPLFTKEPASVFRINGTRGDRGLSHWYPRISRSRRGLQGQLPGHAAPPGSRAGLRPGRRMVQRRCGSAPATRRQCASPEVRIAVRQGAPGSQPMRIECRAQPAPHARHACAPVPAAVAAACGRGSGACVRTRIRRQPVSVPLPRRGP